MVDDGEESGDFGGVDEVVVMVSMEMKEEDDEGKRME